jgi:hypothetical protein
MAEEKTMRTRTLFLPLGLVILLAVAARADKIRSDYDHTAHFDKYKTFMWIQEPEVKEPFMAQRIKNSVNAQLEARGMRLQPKGADLAVGAHVATEEKNTLETYYSGGWEWGAGGWATTETRTYYVGTLTVDLLDAQTHKPVWQGVGVDKLSSKPEKVTRDYDKQIEKMFREFPR